MAKCRRVLLNGTVFFLVAKVTRKQSKQGWTAVLLGGDLCFDECVPDQYFSVCLFRVFEKSRHAACRAQLHLQLARVNRQVSSELCMKTVHSAQNSFWLSVPIFWFSSPETFFSHIFLSGHKPTPRLHILGTIWMQKYQKSWALWHMKEIQIILFFTKILIHSAAISVTT